MPEEEDYPVAVEHMAAFGTIIQWFARHEKLMQITMAGIMKSELLPIMALTSGLPYSGKRNAFRSLLHALPFGREGDIDVEKLTWFAGELHKHNQLRNSIAHSTWVAGNRADSIKPMEVDVRSGKAKLTGVHDDEKDYTLPELWEIANELGALYNKFLDHLDKSGLIKAIAQKMLDSHSDISPSPGNPSAK